MRRLVDSASTCKLTDQPPFANDHMVRVAPIHAVKPARKLTLRRLSAYVGASVGAVLLGLVLLVVVFGDVILDGYGRRKAERAFAAAHPGCALQIGELHYAVGANRLVAHSVTLSATNLTLQVGRISLTGVRWARLLSGTTDLAAALAAASLDATNLDVEFPQTRYGIRCTRLRASVPGSELIAEGTELRALLGDEAFFAAHEFRTTRFHVIVPECRVLGLAFGELLQGKSWRATSIEFSQPSFDALVNRDRPVDPLAPRPLMVHEALAAIRQPLQVDRLSLTNGQLIYRERVVAGTVPGVLTFGAVSLSVQNIANRGEASAAIQLKAQSDLMDAGTLKLLMSIPIAPTDFALRYSGSLSAMDLTRLGAFLEIAERTRIKSGSVEEVSFEIEVTAGEARGRVRAIYSDLVIAVLDQETGTEAGVANRVATFLANALKIQRSNAPDTSGSTKEGKVNYTRNPDDEFLQFAWFALRSGVLDAINP